ncbi:hypothetical protein ACFFIO_07105 [Citricoccus parietis]|uniref:DUF2188 domain-containing protein n=1 Tax=Citricoccus parietis TaxID=592307 RepID=A0ABV6F423_9MICC
MTQDNFVVYCTHPNDGRGEYSEEIDVKASTATEAKKKAQETLDADYEPGMRAVRTKRVPAGFWH